MHPLGYHEIHMRYPGHGGGGPHGGGGHGGGGPQGGGGYGGGLLMV